MQGIEAITAEILASAKSEAEETVKKAEDFRASRLTELKTRLETQKAELETRLAKEADDIVARRLTLAGLEVRMSRLGAKQSVVAETYGLALKKAAALDDPKYRVFYERLVSTAANDGDRVRVAAPDADRLDDAWLKGVSARSGKKLTLLAETFDARGGVIVESVGSETDLTLETLLSEIREHCESEVLSALFGDAK